MGSLALSDSQPPREKEKKTEFQTSRKVGVLIFQLVARWRKKDKTKYKIFLNGNVKLLSS